MQNDSITLVKKTFTTDEYGDNVATETTREVFAEAKSIGMREKYEALQAGLDPEFTFILADYYEYDDESEIIYEDKRFRVIRTYRNGKALELTVTRDNSEPAPVITAS